MKSSLKSMAIPLNSHASGPSLSIVLAVMIFLATLSLAGAIALSAQASQWGRGLDGEITVEVSHLGRNADSTTARADRAAALIRTQKDVRGVRILPPTEVAALLKPWFEDLPIDKDLPLPTLISVHVDKDGAADALKQILAPIAGVSLDDHGKFVDGLSRLANFARGIAITIIALISGVTLLMIGFAVRIGFDLHHELIDLLHTLGASDGFIAGQFQRYAVRLAMVAGAIGFGIAMATLIAFEMLSGPIDLPFSTAFRLDIVNILLLTSVPIMGVAMAAMVSRISVLLALRATP
jgi:cell division transport system permease protein